MRLDPIGPSSARTFLQCPYEDKDEARILGAKWDPRRKQWYVQPGVALDPFLRWLPAGRWPPLPAVPEDFWRTPLLWTIRSAGFFIAWGN